jgi:hypothetical protein
VAAQLAFLDKVRTERPGSNEPACTRRLHPNYASKPPTIKAKLYARPLSVLGGRTGSERLSMSKQAARFADNGIHVSVLPPLIDHNLNDIVLLAPAPAAPQSLKLTYEVPAMLRIQVKHQNVGF